MNFDPTLLEALVAALMTLLGAGAGLGVRRHARSRNAAADDGPQPTPLAQQQAELAAKLAEVAARLDRLVDVDLPRIEEQARQQRRAHARLGADFDAVADALDVLVTHIAAGLPEQAQRSVADKLQRRQRHEITGVRAAAR